MVNLFPEAIPEGGKTQGFLTRAPGLRVLAQIGAGPIRGMWSFGGKGYVASGNELYRVDSDWIATKLGDISGSGPVSMADNGTQLFVACNGPSYIYNVSTGVFAPITTAGFTGAVTVGYIDGYFVFNQPNSQKIWITSLLDGTAVDPLDFASAEGSPDELISLIVDHREVWLFGTNSVEVWYNSGDEFPLSRIQGAFNEIGCAAAYSVAKLDNGLFWLGADARGHGVVYRANGYTGQRISTHAVEWQIQQYGSLSDAIGYTYQQDGHAFYVLVFPNAAVSWVYDVATQAWHERAGWSVDRFVRHRSNCQMAFGGETVVGDYANGRIYALDLNVFEDDSQPQKWLRSWRALPTGQSDLKRTAHHSLQLDLETGIGFVHTTGLLLQENGDLLLQENGGGLLIEEFQSTPPQVMLRWSDDGGHTWSNEHWASTGAVGEHGYRTIWRRLGMTEKLRDRVYEVSGTDPVKIAIVGAELYVTPTRA